jgi:hypothetical protein
MLELNYTYEESKKILELGYDFSSVCTKFEFRENEEATTLTFLYSCGEIVTMWNPRMSEPYSYHLKSSPASGIIPIIPKAALEACLPFKVGIDARYFRKFYKTTYSEEEFEVYQAGVNELESNAVIFSSSSIYEMFTWLHENYPEELKKKFDEVMA